MPTQLQRFIAAQDHGGAYEQALAELRAGAKRGHWIWFVFPQIAGLGFSEMSRRYAISSRDEASAYLAHPVLGPRLIACAQALLDLPGDQPAAVMGELDAVKLRSSMTLFARADAADLAFARVLEKYFAGERDPVTEARLVGESEQLAGGMGNGGRVLRRGDVVVRPTGPHSGATHQLLRALEPTPFTAPVPITPEANGVQEFRWIAGDVGVPPFPAWVLTDEALASAGRLLRRYHDTVAQFEFPADLDWSDEGLTDPGGGPIICHNDVCPENVVFREGHAVALLDFDLAAPGRRVWDLAHMARMWAPMRPPDLVVGGMVGLDPFHRLRVLAGAYGLEPGDHEEFSDAIVQSGRQAMGFVRKRLEAGEAAFVNAWEPLGGIQALDRILGWLTANRGWMLDALR